MPEKILITGSSSNIAKNLQKFIPKKNIIKKINSTDIDFSKLENIEKKKIFFYNLIKFFFFTLKLVLKD